LDVEREVEQNKKDGVFYQLLEKTNNGMGVKSKAVANWTVGNAT